MTRITNVEWKLGTDRILIVTTEDGIEETFEWYDIRDPWASGVETGWRGSEPFERWAFENGKHYQNYMRGYNKAVEDKKVA